MTERSEVQFGLTPIRYSIQRSGRRRTVSIAIDAADGVIVTAPASATVQRLDEIVRRKATWILERLKRTSSLPPPPPAREFVSGESFLYLGRSYRLKVQRGEEPSVRLARGWLVVTSHEDVRGALIEWYREHAKERLPARVGEWAKRIGLPVPRTVLRSQSKRWASCDRSGLLRINWRIIQAPMRLVDYVVAHELAHLIHPDHTAAFWRRLGRAMPDYEERRASLRELGRGVEW